MNRTNEQINKNYLTELKDKCFVACTEDENSVLILAKNYGEALIKLLEYNGIDAFELSTFTVAINAMTNLSDMVILYNRFIYDDDYELKFIAEISDLHLVDDYVFVK